MVPNDDPYQAIEREMAEIRTSIQADVRQAVNRAKELTDWRTHVRHHPWLFLGAVSTLGFVLARKSLDWGRARARHSVDEQHATAFAPAMKATSMPVPSLAHDVARWATSYAVRNAVQWLALQAAERMLPPRDAERPLAGHDPRIDSTGRNEAEGRWRPQRRDRRDYHANGDTYDRS